MRKPLKNGGACVSHPHRLDLGTVQLKLSLIEKALQALKSHEIECRLCPRNCRIDRGRSKSGYCGSGLSARLSHSLLHYGEEPVLSGPSPPAGSGRVHPAGSGTLFFSGCSLKCLYCQNYQLSWENMGKDLSPEELADEMLRLQTRGALNINLVTPGHFLIPILKALHTAYHGGLEIPLVYNSSGYEKAEILRILDGIIDIYLPDLKYAIKTTAETLSSAPDYFSHAAPALIEMYCQQPVLRLTNHETAVNGLIVRHLVIPGEQKNSILILDWLSRNLSPAIGLSLMRQYRPHFRTPQSHQRTLESKEYETVVDYAQKLGFEFLFVQPEPFAEGENLIPDFSRRRPFDWK